MRFQVTAVVLDMDGTLFDSSAIVPAAYRTVVASRSSHEVTTRDVIAAYGVGPPRLLLGHLMGRAATPEDVVAYHAELRRVATQLRPYDGLADALGLLADHVPLAVFSGADRAACRILLEATGLAACFRALVGSDEVPNPKPMPDGILEACARLGVDAARSAYVGDAPRDLEAARRSGALAVAAAWGHEFDPGGSTADVVLRTPPDLLRLIA